VNLLAASCSSSQFTRSKTANNFVISAATFVGLAAWDRLFAKPSRAVWLPLQQAKATPASFVSRDWRCCKKHALVSSVKRDYGVNTPNPGPARQQCCRAGLLKHCFRLTGFREQHISSGNKV
jgi:hypothetical protein